MTTPSRWDDLGPRLASAAVLAIVGLGAVFAGDPWVSGLASVVAGVMMWELARLTAPDHRREAVLIGLIAAATLAVVLLRHNPFWLAWLVLPVLLGALRPRRDRAGFVLVGLAIMLSCYAFVAFRGGLGLSYMVWLIGIVVASDTLGYFGGRLIGGPKFWPRLSPKKTWSGTIAGWVGAMAVGVAFWLWVDAPFWIVPLSALVALAGQLGDITESAVKRRAGIKDASALIPGHGGFMDRLDALCGAALFLLAWGLILPHPPMPGGF